MTSLIILLGVAYVIGSIPTGYWLGKMWRGIDIRTQGSGNLGATNVFRVLGPKAGALTLALDILKGFLPTHAVLSDSSRAFNSLADPTSSWMDPLILAMLVGFFAILGHTFSVFMRFRGGKGVATSAGVFLAILPTASSIAIAAFAVCFAVTRTVSASSIAGSVTLAIAAFFFSPLPVLSFAAAAVAALVIWAHRANIQRLMAGTEPRIGLKGNS